MKGAKDGEDVVTLNKTLMEGLVDLHAYFQKAYFSTR